VLAQGKLKIAAPVQYRGNMGDENIKDDFWNNETAKHGSLRYEK
jgi:hypothetical protein